MKKRNIIAVVLSIAMVLTIGSIFAADSVLGITERHTASSKTNSFVVNTTNSFSSSSKYYVNFTASSTSQTIHVKNIGEVNDSYDVLLLGTSGTVKTVNNEGTPIGNDLNANTVETYSLTGLTNGSVYTVAVINHHDYNVFVNSYLDIQLLNNEYHHKMEDNDIKLDSTKTTAVYTEVQAATITAAIDNYTGDEALFFYDNIYYNLVNGIYILARGQYDNTKTYYVKTMIYSDIYDINAYKNVYLLNNINVDSASYDSGDPTRHYINFPCSINLLTYDINLDCNYGIHHYYGSLFTIDTISGQINNGGDSARVFTIDTPRAYYSTSSADATVFNSTTAETLIKHCDVSESTYKNAMLADAKNFVDSYFKTDCSYDSNSDGTDEQYTVMLTNLDLPQSYCDFAVRYEYLDGANSFVYRRQSSNQFKTLTVNIYYDSELQSTLSLTRKVWIVGTSDAALFAAYTAELSQYLNTFANNTAANSVLIGNNNDNNSLQKKYSPYLTNSFTYAVSSTNDSFTSTTKLALTNREVDSTNYGSFLSRNGYAFVNGEVCYLQVCYNSTLYYYIPVTLQTKTAAERTELIARYAQNLYIENIYPVDLLSADDSSIASAGAINILYSPYVSSTYDVNTDTWSNWAPTNKFVIDTANNQIRSAGPMSYNAGVKYVVRALNIYPGDSFDVNGTTIDASTKTYEQIIAYLTDENITSSELSALNTFINDRTMVVDLVIPPTGIGGTGGAAYIGSLFQQKFDNFAQLLGETDDFTAIGYYYLFEIDYSTMGGVMSQDFIKCVIDYFGSKSPAVVLTDANVKANLNNCVTEYLGRYLTLTSTHDDPDSTDVADDSHAYSFSVSTDYVPTADTIVYVKAYITAVKSEALANIKEGETRIEQTYSFTIPGIYNHLLIPDNNLYAELLLQYNNAYTDPNDVRADFLLVSEAKKNKDVLDLSGKSIANIRGIQYLTNTKEIILNGISLTSNTALDYLFEMKNLECLRAVGCGLTDTNTADINQLEYLIEADLSNNSLTDVPTFYRRLRTLNLSNQANLTAIDNVSTNYFLESINLEGNNIASFEPLKKLSTLKEAFVYNNTSSTSITGFTGTPYGTTGKLNIPVFVALSIRGVNVYTVQYDANKIVYDSNGNVYATVYDSSKNIITTNPFTVSTSQKMYDNNGVEITAIYDSNGDAITITSVGTEIILSHQTSQDIKNLAVALNSITTFSTYITNLTMPSVLYVGSSSSPTSTYTITIDYIDGVAQNLTPVSNVYTSGNLTTGVSHTVIISITDGTNTVYREIGFKVV